MFGQDLQRCQRISQWRRFNIVDRTRAEKDCGAIRLLKIDRKAKTPGLAFFSRKCSSSPHDNRYITHCPAEVLRVAHKPRIGVKVMPAMSAKIKYSAAWSENWV